MPMKSLADSLDQGADQQKNTQTQIPSDFFWYLSLPSWQPGTPIMTGAKTSGFG